MIVKNNDIYLTRGENGTVTVSIWNSDGTPFILPQPTQYRWPLLAFASKRTITNGEIYEFHTPMFFEQNPDVSNSPWWNCIIQLKDLSENFRIIADAYGWGHTGGTAYHMTGTAGSPTIRLRLPASEGLARITIYGAKLDAIIDSYKDGTASGIRGVAYEVESEKPVSCLAFTVRAANYDKVVLTKYLNLMCAPMINGKTDYSPFGWNKFYNQEIVKYDTLDEALADLLERRPDSKDIVADVDGKFYQLVYTVDGFGLQPYEFSMTIPLLYEDTKDLEAGEYVYDVIAYQGIITDERAYTENIFPYSKVLWKKELVMPHKFIIGDSNNA